MELGSFECDGKKISFQKIKKHTFWTQRGSFLCVCVCVRVCACVQIFTYEHIYLHVQNGFWDTQRVCVFVCVHLFLYMCVFVCAHVFVYEEHVYYGFTYAE